jgi:hypothetical protein
MIVQPLGIDEKCPLPIGDLQLNPSCSRYLSRPGACGIDHHFCLYRINLSTNYIFDEGAFDLLPLNKQSLHFSAGQGFGAPFYRTLHIDHHQIKGIDACVRDRKNPSGSLAEQGLSVMGIRQIQFFKGKPGVSCSICPFIDIIRGIPL